jgi:hypothetical protein
VKRPRHYEQKMEKKYKVSEKQLRTTPQQQETLFESEDNKISQKIRFNDRRIHYCLEQMDGA